MRRFTEYAVAATLTGAIALLAATPSQARWWHGHGWHNGPAAAFGFGAGAILGAAAANAAYPGYYGHDYNYGPGYAYDYSPGYDYGYARAPVYREYGYRSGRQTGGNCIRSPASYNFSACE